MSPDSTPAPPTSARSTVPGDDVLIVGAGVIGLSLAYELSLAGVRVRLLDRQAPGREASWAGAGILPPANRADAEHPYDQLRGLAAELHPRWAEALREETGIDNGYHRCGGLYVARTAGESAAVLGMIGMWEDEGLEVERLSPEQLAEQEPGLESLARAAPRLIVRLPGEAQLRNPRHLKALRAALEQRGVAIESDNPVVDFNRQGDRIESVITQRGPRSADRYCVTSGAWSVQLLKALEVPTGVLPIRGQMLLFKLPQRLFGPIINEGPRYLVPRPDGYVLAGSTEEEVGFEKETTDSGLNDLAGFARSLVPELTAERQVRAWAGLRPGSFDGFPYLGSLPGIENAYVATGHFRSGLTLAPATARVMSQLIRGETPEVSLEPFGVLR